MLLTGKTSSCFSLRSCLSALASTFEVQSSCLFTTVHFWATTWASSLPLRPLLSALSLQFDESKCTHHRLWLQPSSRFFNAVTHHRLWLQSSRRFLLCTAAAFVDFTGSLGNISHFSMLKCHKTIFITWASSLSTNSLHISICQHKDFSEL